MKKLVLGLTAIVLLLTIMPTPANAIDIVPSSDPPTTSPILLTRYSFLSGNLRIVQLYNDSDEIINLAGWKLLVVRSGSVDEQEIMSFQGLIAPGTHVAAVDTQAISVATGTPSYQLPSSTVTNSNITRIVLRAPATANYLDQSYAPVGTISNSTVYDFNRSTTGSGSYSTAVNPFLLMNPPESVPLADDGLYVAPPLNECTSLRLNEIGANLSNQFIEIYNAGSTNQEIGGCVLQTNRSSTVSYKLPGGVLVPGQIMSIDIAITNLTLTKTTSGTVYILSSDEQTEVDARYYENLSESTSLSLVDGVWYQTFMITPGGSNVYQEYPRCEVGYERNLETGRCNKVSTAIVSTASSLTPCAANQYRSPDTNRCRLVSTATSSLAACREGQERNPDTNRCRNIISTDVPKAAFAVEPVKDTGRAFVGWWALGGIGTFALGYAGWEWRREIVAGIHKIRMAFTSGK